MTDAFGPESTGDWEAFFSERLSFPEEEPPALAPYLINALERAREEVLQPLDGFSYSVVKELGRLVVEWKQPIAVTPEQEEFLSAQLLKNGWFRRGAELVLAEAALDRATSGFDRLHELQSVVSRSLPRSRAAPYLHEVSQCYLLGLDGACLALCGAALEQAMKETLAKRGQLTEWELRERHFSAGELLDLSMQNGLIVKSRPDARNVLHERNRAMHRHLWDARIIRQMALNSVQSLLAVLGELVVDEVTE